MAYFYWTGSFTSLDSHGISNSEILVNLTNYCQGFALTSEVLVVRQREVLTNGSESVQILCQLFHLEYKIAPYFYVSCAVLTEHSIF